VTTPDPRPAPTAAPIAEPPEKLPPARMGPRARLAAAIADAVATLPGAALTDRSGVCTQYPGGTVPGVALTDESVKVQIVAGTLPLPPLIDMVGRAAAAVLAEADDSRPLHVHIADLDLTGQLSRAES
jgi:hypothetical protein